MRIFKLLLPILLYFSCSQIVSSAILEQVFTGVTSCETDCEKEYPAPSIEQKKSCHEGCRLFTIIGLAKGLSKSNKTLTLCLSACSEAYNETSVEPCHYGCKRDAVVSTPKDEPQTLHLLTPLMYIRSAYNSMSHHVRQFVSTSWTVYIQEDTGKMVVLQTKPKVIETSDLDDNTQFNDNENDGKSYQHTWQEERLDWMDCISHQSGLPRWLLFVVVFGFTFALLWLCCITTVSSSAPNNPISSEKCGDPKSIGYVLVCEPVNDIKQPLLLNEEAPPLPPKIIPV